MDPLEGMDKQELLQMERFNNYEWCPENRGPREMHRIIGLVHVADNSEGHKPICVKAEDIAQDIDPETLKGLLP